MRVSKKQTQLSLDSLPDECFFEILHHVTGGHERGGSTCISRR
jgi:hypothetical protein